MSTHPDISAVLEGRSQWAVVTGDCLAVLPTLPPGSVDSIVCDPPYGLSFMGKEWDHGVPGVAFWVEALRVAKPGAHLLAFGGTRTFHRLACAIEDAGWEMRDTLGWLYGSGFPKSLDVSKAIDAAAGADREVMGTYTVGGTAAKGKHKGRADAAADEGSAIGCTKDLQITAPATNAARQWSGWGTALKPAWEPIILARKPLAGTVATNVLAHGTGGINVEECRVGDIVESWPKSRSYGGGTEYSFTITNKGVANSQPTGAVPAGRWPANILHDGSDEVEAVFPESVDGVAGRRTGVANVTLHGLGPAAESWGGYGGGGSASRFFYCAKASKEDRDAGVAGVGALRDGGRESFPRRNHHPTVKPSDLMAYLCRLVTPPNGIVLDPFMGSGSTGKAAMRERFRFVGIDLNPEYAAIAAARITDVAPLFVTKP